MKKNKKVEGPNAFGDVVKGGAKGAAIGTGIGLALAPFTMGLSIPVGATVGGTVGSIRATDASQERIANRKEKRQERRQDRRDRRQERRDSRNQVITPPQLPPPPPVPETPVVDPQKEELSRQAREVMSGNVNPAQADYFRQQNEELFMRERKGANSTNQYNKLEKITGVNPVSNRKNDKMNELFGGLYGSEESRGF
tara:strand:- start:174 stop:764 length:591 start_codon:yes stop_codon:yes gene_type:complete